VTRPHGRGDSVAVSPREPFLSVARRGKGAFTATSARPTRALTAASSVRAGGR
jgi:hypothetical protein